MKKIVALFITLSTLLFSSCEVQEVTFSGIENIKVNELSQKGIDIDITAKIKNPNNTSFTVYKSNVDVEVGGINLGTARLTKKVRVKANAEQSYTFNVKSDLSKLNVLQLPNLLNMFAKRSVNVKLNGKLKVGKFLLRKAFKIALDKNVPLGRNE